METDQERLGLTSCDVVGEDMPESRVRVRAPAVTPAPITVTYGQGPLSDSIGIGGALAARVPPFAFELTIPELDSDSDGSSTSGPAADEAFPDPDLGCTCATGRNSAIPMGWLALLFLYPRRAPRRGRPS